MSGIGPEQWQARYGADWAALERLTARARRPRRMSGAELDALVELYQRVSAQLVAMRSADPDPAAVDRLAGLVNRARAAVTGARDPSWSAAGRFAWQTFPVAVYQRWRWCLGAAGGSVLAALALGIWVAHSGSVQGQVLGPRDVRQLVDHDFAAYYRSAPAAAFAARVWSNNVVVAAAALTLGVLLGLPTLFVLAENAVNVGVSAGLLAAHGRLGEFFVLILPHGMLELSAVFVAAGTGLRLGWRVVDPGPLPRGRALAEEGRSAVTVAVGLVGVLAVSGLLEAFVTASPLPAAARLAIGAGAELAFLALVVRRGRAAVAAGIGADVDAELAGGQLPAG